MGSVGSDNASIPHCADGMNPERAPNVEQFEQAFPGKSEAVTFENMAKAIEVFEATLLTPDSPSIGICEAMAEP